jgi:PAS domain S-box-containing protein
MKPLSRASSWTVTVGVAVLCAALNHVFSVGGDGRLTFMLLYPAVLLGGYLRGALPAMVAAVIGAGALMIWHPEMRDGRTAVELGEVGLFLLTSVVIGGMFHRLHALRGREFAPLIPEPPSRMNSGAWAAVGLAFVASLALSFSLNAVLQGRVPFVFFYPVIALAGYLGGGRPAMAVGVAGAIATYLWHPGLPRNSVETAVVCGLFLIVAALMGWLSEQLHRASDSARAGAAALRELPEAQARFAAIAQTSPDSLWIWDLKQGRLTFISPASEKLSGYTPAEACAFTKEEGWAQIHPEDQDLVRTTLRQLTTMETGQTAEYEYRQRHRDGTWRWIRNRAGVFTRDEAGRVNQIFGHSEDVTERRDAAERLTAQAAELARIAEAREAALHERQGLLEAERAARAEAERANQLKDDFLATVSHELRTPLTAMLGWTAMLSEEVQDPELRQGLEIISRNARAQRQLIEDLLDMSRIMTGKLRIEPQPVLLADVIHSAVETVTPAAEARGVALISFAEQDEEPIQADAERLQQIIWNLLSNGVKFTPAGGQVRIEATRTPTEAIISVADTGQGMAPDFVPHVFERFRQEDGATTRKAGGLGIGLAIVKHLVELHGGTVSAASEGLGRGSVFTVSLPMQARVESRFGRPDPAKKAEPVSGKALAGRRLLVVDDETDTRSYLERVLVERGAQVMLAETAAEGLRKAQECAPEAIICDISMPGEDGYSFIRQLRLANHVHIPTAALTALARTEDRQKALGAGFDEHCSKPLEPVEVVALVERLLAESKNHLG